MKQLLAFLALSSLACSRELTLPEVNPLVATPGFASVAPRERLQVGASGGTSPFAFAMSRGSGSGATVNAATGEYQAGPIGPAQDVIEVTDAGGHLATVTVAVGPRLAISPQLTSVAPGASVQFSASGGKPPYAFALAGTGSASRMGAVDGLYVAGPAGDLEEILVASDATGDAAATSTGRVLVGQAVSLFRVGSGSIAPGDSTTLVALGGQPPHAFSIPAALNGSGGMVHGDGTYQAGLTGGTTDTVVVTDHFKQTASMALPIGPTLALSLGSSDVHPGVTVKLTATGGKPPYRFGFQPRGNRSRGEVNSSSGDYTPGQNAGAVDLLMVQDATGVAQATPALQPQVGALRLPATGPTTQCLAADFTGDRRDDALLFQGTTLQLWSLPVTLMSHTIDHFLWYSYGPGIAGPFDGAFPAKVAIQPAGPYLFFLAPDLTGTLGPVGPAPGVPTSIGQSLSFGSRVTGPGTFTSSVFTNQSCAGGFTAVDWAYNAAGPTSPAFCVQVSGLGSSALSLVAADLNGDGYTDLAWPVGPGGTTVAVAFGVAGTATFALPALVSLPSGYHYAGVDSTYSDFIPVASMGGGSARDLLLRVVDSSGRGNLVLVKGTAAPAVAPGSPFDPLPASASGVFGVRQVGTSTYHGETLVAWDGLSGAVAGYSFDATGAPLLRAASDPVLASDPAFPVSCVASGDFDGDGLWDLLLASGSGAVAEVRFGDGLGFGRRPRFLASGPLAIADVDGDGLDDLVTGTPTPGLAVLLGSGHQLAFQSEVALPRAASAVAVGVLAEGVLGATWQDVLGAFWTATIDASGKLGTPSALDVRDPNGAAFTTLVTPLHAAPVTGGAADLWSAGTATGRPLHLIRPTSPGHAVHLISPALPPGACMAAPLSGGAGDVVAACAPSYGAPLVAYRSTLNGAGTAFGAWISAASTSVGAVNVMSYAGQSPDGAPVFVTANGATAGVFTVARSGAGLSATAVNVSGTSDSLWTGAVADLNGDGIPDLVAQIYPSGGVDVLLGDASGGYTFFSRASGSAQVVGAARLQAGRPPDVITRPTGSGTMSVIPLVNDGVGHLR